MDSFLQRIKAEKESYFLIAYVIVNGLASLVILPLLTRNLTIRDLGIFGSISSLAFFFQMMVEGGFNTLGPRRLMANPEAESDNSVIASVTHCKVALLITVSLFAVPVHLYFGFRLGRPLESMLIFLAAAVTAFNPNWVLITRGKSLVFFLASAVLRIGYVVSIVLVCRWGMTLSLLCTIQLLVALVGVVVSYAQIDGFRVGEVFLTRIRVSWGFIRESMLLLVGNISDVALFSLSPALLSRLCGPEQAAFLFAIDKIRLLATDVISMVTRRMFSEIFQPAEPGATPPGGVRRPKAVFPIVFLLACGAAISIAVVCFSEVIIYVFGTKKFMVAKAGILVFSAFPFLMSMATASMLFRLVKHGLFRSYAWSSVVACLAGFLLVPAMAGRYGYLSVVLAWLLAQLLKVVLSQAFFQARGASAEVSHG